jgi:hypothetical protein
MMYAEVRSISGILFVLPKLSLIRAPERVGEVRELDDLFQRQQ